LTAVISQFAECAGLQGLGNLDHLVVVEIEASHGVAALELGRLLFDAAGLAIRIEGAHAVALRVVHVVREHGGADRFESASASRCAKSWP
jgi:hypothetical protein